MTANTSSWIDYWRTLPEGQLLFAPEAEEFAANLLHSGLLNPRMQVLDYGCGYAAVASRLAPHVGQIDYWDAAENMMAVASRQMQNLKNASVWNETEGQYDLIIVNSVVQYLDAESLTFKLGQWRSMLADGGILLLADLIPVGHAKRRDMFDLLKFSLRRGYFRRALAKTLAERKRYDAAANANPLFQIDPAWLESQAAAAGFSLRWLPRNLSHFRSRKTAILSPIA